MSSMPQVDVWVRAGMIVFTLLMVAVIVVYHVWLDRLHRRRGAQADAPAPARDPRVAGPSPGDRLRR